MLYAGSQFDNLVRQVSQDIASVSPETRLISHELPISDAWDFENVYGALYDFANNYPFDPDKEDYWIHITTGSHVVQICMFLMTEARYFPGRLVQTSPPKRQGAGNPGSYALIDLDLSRYDQIAQRFTREQAEGVAFLKSGIATRNARFNGMIDEIERVAIKSKAPMLLMGATGAGKSVLARRVYELKNRAIRSMASSSTSIAPPCMAMAQPPPCSGISRVPSRGRARTGQACFAARTRDCCFSMKSANWGSTNRRCC